MQPRTKLALKMNTLVGIPVIVAETVFSQLPVSALGHFALASLGGYSVSLVFVWASLKLWKVSQGA